MVHILPPEGSRLRTGIAKPPEGQNARARDLPAYIQSLVTAFANCKWVATVERTIHNIEQKIDDVSQYSVKFQVATADLDCNPSAFINAPRMRFMEQMRHFFEHSNMPKELSAFLAMYQKLAGSML